MDNMMSPRRLGALRANGNNILGAKATDLEAARNYKTGQMDIVSNATSRVGGGVRAQHPADMMDTQQFNQMDNGMDQQLHLVPCRWERSGWRYVQKDPKEHGFFRNPNRVNNFGVQSAKRRFVSQTKQSHNF